MKKIIIVISFISIIFLVNACKESGTDNPEGEVIADVSYFPTSDGTYYKFTVSQDSNGTSTNGDRFAHYNGTEVKGTTTYQVQVDTLYLEGLALPSTESFFRRTDTGVFFYLDTTGLSASVPGLDTLVQYLTIDGEMRLLVLPVYDNSDWTVFKMNLNYQGIINFNPVELKAVYDGKENFVINSQTIETVRIKFTLSYRGSPFSAVQVFEPAYGCLAPNIGFVKWHGNGTIIGVFTGNGIDFDDSTSVYTQNLIDYRIGN